MSEEKQRENQKAYEKYVKKITPVHNLPLNMLKAFLTGGLICVLGHEFYWCLCLPFLFPMLASGATSKTFSIDNIKL